MTVTQDRLAHYREQIAAERLRILANVDALREEFSGSMTDESEENGLETHIGDQGTATFLRERDISLEAHEEQLLADIDLALGRIAHGTYGVCINCGTDIPEERLDALPWAIRCIDCQRDADG
jgi:RNA polymerase-binding protein DksA